MPPPNPTKMNTDDPRTGTLILPFKNLSLPQLALETVVLVGFPHDEGVRRNGGRVGAAGGPNEARNFIHKLGTVRNPEFSLDISKLNILDAGNVENAQENSSDLELAHQQLIQRLTDIYTIPHATPFVIGGGNDQSFPNGYSLLQFAAESNKKVGIINIDAHLDVRPLKEGKTHSGSPFFQLLTCDLWPVSGAGFLEFAAQGNQCSVVHADYVTKEQKQQICWFSTIRKHKSDHNYELPYGSNHVVELLEKHINQMASNPDYLFISFDIDSIQGSDCPGVSCPATIGLTAEEALDICFWAGREQKVKLFDLSEYNPAAESYRTGRLVANMFYFFLLGRASR